MSRSLFYLKDRRIVLYPSDSDGSLQDMRLFLEQLHESLNEIPDIMVNEDSLELRLKDAPKVWHLLNALRTNQIDVSVYPASDGSNYIRLGNTGPTN